MKESLFVLHRGSLRLSVSSLSEYDDFKEELKTKGADILLQLYKDNSLMADMTDLSRERKAQR